MSSSFGKKVQRAKLHAHKRKREEQRGLKKHGSKTIERIHAVAIMRPGLGVIDGGHGSHATLRHNLDPSLRDPTQHIEGDVEGFIVSPDGRFVERRTAADIAFRAGQCPHMRRGLLSSDINW